MAQWNNYSQKSAPDDTDTLILKDNTATGAPNKRLLFSALWSWIVGKLINATIDALSTSPKTVVGGLNALNSKVANVFVYEVSTDAGTSNWKIESSNGNFPSVFVFGANGSAINQTIQVLGSGVDSIFNGDSTKNLLPVKVSNSAFTITVWEYARLLIVSRTPLTITRVTS